MRNICAFGWRAFIFALSFTQKGNLKMKNAPRPTAEMIKAAQRLAECRAALETLRPVVLKIKTDLLSALAITDEDGQPITDPSRAWLMDEKFHDVYYPALNDAYQAAGFDVPADFCPLLMAENDEREAMREINVLGINLVPAHIRPNLSKIYDPKILRQMADLNLEYISQFIKN